MSLNTAHADDKGVLIHAGEQILLYGDDVTMEFNRSEPAFRGTKKGRIYLTTHRMIFNSKKKDAMMSFSFPFVALKMVKLKQPVFGANYMEGVVEAQPNGNWNGEAKFKLMFNVGGAIDFCEAMFKATKLVKDRSPYGPLPPYEMPRGPYYPAPPPAYTPEPTGYNGWTVPPSTFTANGPPPNTVFTTDAPPPYYGISGPPQTGPYAPSVPQLGTLFQN
ncbi:UNVERIFIED_CONTAM: hypothetical protein PYX00_008085 [Menopon gallinae]|uniref:GRAM domain-containing protein n=1 Tax=Menopon gallinae TaxID=328185 RepID=A0AAW2HLV8_9NEOP